MKNKILVSCLGWCNKKFLSHDPKTNRICSKCQDKMNNKKNEMGKNYFYEKKISKDE